MHACRIRSPIINNSPCNTMLQNEFGKYHIFQNNCDDFAMYCKIGFLSIEKNGLGISGHATSIIGAPLVAILSSPFRIMLVGIVGVATIMAGVYCLSRYATNIGIHTDVDNVLVEDLAVNLCWSTDSEPSFDESSTTQALRRNKSSIHNIEGCEIFEGLVPN